MYEFGLRGRNEVVDLRYGTLRDALRTGKLLVRARHERRTQRTLELTSQQMAVVQELESSRLNSDGHLRAIKFFALARRAA